MSIANKVFDFFEFWYYQYILVTALYMLEFWERAVFSILTSRLERQSYRFSNGYIVEIGHAERCLNIESP